MNSLPAASFILLSVSLLVGCGAPSTRADNPDLFKEVASGNVDSAKIPEFLDCVMDGFSRSQRQGTNVQVTQQKRSFGFRAEVMSGPHLILSTDIYQDGKTKLMEGYAAKFISTRNEIAEFDLCIKRFSRS
jgi:hypothetical protein